jgi:rare lipoprotein A
MTSYRWFTASISLVASLLIFGCASTPRFTEKDSHDHEGTVRPREESRAKEDQPAHVAPTGKALLTLEGVVSYYAHDFHGKETSNGETFNMNNLTAAHRTFPFGTKVKVTNLENNKSVIVRVNDRGPFVVGRIMDLSMGAAKEIDLIKTGTTRARLEVLQWGDGQ